MSFQIAHKLLTFHGQLWTGNSTETWSFGFRFAPPPSPPPITQAMVDACDAAFRTAWNSAAAVSMAPQHSYQYAKLAPIDVNGRYPSSSISYQSAAVTLAGKGSSALAPWPSQCSVAVTLITSKPGARGRASKGRVYLPPLATTISASGLITGTTATNQATWIANLLTSLNAVSGLGTASVMSSIGAGEGYPIYRVTCGLVVDTVRRRRRQLVESYVTPVNV